MSDQPFYIDPKSGEKLVTEKNLKNQLYLTNKIGVSYPIVKGIPRILKNFDNYSLAFGEQWIRWRKTQLDSYTKTNISEEKISTYGKMAMVLRFVVKNNKKLFTQFIIFLRIFKI